MKTLTTFLQEVGQPRAKGEKDFKDLHMKNVEVSGYDKPKTGVDKDKTRKADKAPVKEDEQVEENKNFKKTEDLIKKTFGDQRTSFGKFTKGYVKQKAASMNESEDVREDWSDVDALYSSKIMDVLDEMKDLMDAITSSVEECCASESSIGGAYFNAKDTYQLLVDARDRMIASIPSEVKESEEITEDFRVGKVKLKDGTSVNITKENAASLNKFLEDAGSSKSKLMTRAMKSKSEFENILNMAKV